MISDNEPLVNQYISVPKEMSQFNPAALVAGIIEGVCDGAGFSTRGVSAVWANESSASEAAAAGPGAGTPSGAGMWPGKTVLVIRFAPEVLEREEILGRGA